MKKLIVLSIACSLSSMTVLAEEPSFSFLEGGYANGESDTGFLLRGNAELSSNFFLNLGMEWYEDDNDSFEFGYDYIGLGYKHLLDDTTAVYGLINLAELSSEAQVGPVNVGVDSSGIEYGVGVRKQITDYTQVYGQITRIDLENDINGNVFNLGLKQSIMPNLAAYAEVKRYHDSDEPSNEFGIGISYNF